MTNRKTFLKEKRQEEKAIEKGIQLGILSLKDTDHNFAYGCFHYGNSKDTGLPVFKNIKTQKFVN